MYCKWHRLAKTEGKPEACSKQITINYIDWDLSTFSFWPQMVLMPFPFFSDILSESLPTICISIYCFPGIFYCKRTGALAVRSENGLVEADAPRRKAYESRLHYGPIDYPWRSGVAEDHWKIFGTSQNHQCFGGWVIWVSEWMVANYTQTDLHLILVRVRRNLHLARLSFYVEPFGGQESWQKKSLTAEKPQRVVRKMAGVGQKLFGMHTFLQVQHL